MLELERKIPITCEEFQCLWELTAPYATAQKQINYYYDTDDLTMNQKGITCRIREKNGKFTATIKEHRFDAKDCSVEISNPAKNALDNRLFAGNGVNLQGHLVTERVYLVQENDFNIVIDKNTYLGVVDYEIEMEYSPENIQRAEKMIHYFAGILSAVIQGVDYSKFGERTKLAKSKSQRFFQQLIKRKEKEKHIMEDHFFEAQQQYYLAKTEMFKNAALQAQLYELETPLL